MEQTDQKVKCLQILLKTRQTIKNTEFALTYNLLILADKGYIFLLQKSFLLHSCLELQHLLHKFFSELYFILQLLHSLYHNQSNLTFCTHSFSKMQHFPLILSFVGTSCDRAKGIELMTIQKPQVKEASEYTFKWETAK